VFDVLASAAAVRKLITRLALRWCGLLYILKIRLRLNLKIFVIGVDCHEEVTQEAF
jgi:hypothetical protein